MVYGIECTSRPVSIVVIDSGIDTSVSDLGLYVKKSTGYIINADGCIAEDPNVRIMHSHGTAIALAIRHLCSNVEFVSMNILNSRLASNGRVLIRAIRDALLYKPDIIHLSLGTTRWIYKFYLSRLVRKAASQNIIIVAAAHNQGLKCYPAYLKGVVGVKAKPLKNEIQYYYKDNFYHASFLSNNVNGINELSGKAIGGSSLAAAYIAGHIARIRSSCNLTKREDIINALKSRSKFYMRGEVK